MATSGIKLDDETKARLKALGEKRDRTPHWLMKKAIADFLDREEKLDARNRETDEALEHYLKTGQYVSHENMDAWLDTWGTDKEGSCPELES